MTCGSEIGALLVDGLGDGILIACPSQDVGFLRNMSFNILQGARMRNTKTGNNLHHGIIINVGEYDCQPINQGTYGCSPNLHNNISKSYIALQLR